MNVSGDSFSDGISILLPLYNEEENVRAVLSELVEVLNQMDRPFEILCVNDGSTDGTPSVLETCEKEFSGLRLFTHEENQGQSFAFVTGFREARTPWIVTMDADGQHDPADIPRLLEAMGDSDVCCGIRTRRKDTWSKRVGSRLANRARNLLLGSDIQDSGCSLKVFRTEIIRELPTWKGMHRFLPDLCRIHFQSQIVQIPVGHRPRLYGESKYNNWGRLCKTVPDVLAVRKMKRREN